MIESIIFFCEHYGTSIFTGDWWLYTQRVVMEQSSNANCFGLMGIEMAFSLTYVVARVCISRWERDRCKWCIEIHATSLFQGITSVTSLYWSQSTSWRRENLLTVQTLRIRLPLLLLVACDRSSDVIKATPRMLRDGGGILYISAYINYQNIYLLMRWQLRCYPLSYK